MRFKLFVATAILLSITLPAQAEWNKVFTVEYLMGDADNRINARQAGLEQLKLKASSEVGTYIQSTTTLQESGDITESVQMIGASMVKLSEVSDKINLSPSGQMLLSITARASINEDELKRRVESLQQDKERARQLKILQIENADLRRELDLIHNELTVNSNSSNSTNLINKQNKTMVLLIKNNEAITQIFKPGTLLSMADKNKDEFEKIKQDLNERLLKEIINTRIYTQITSVEEKGNKYILYVKISWDMDYENYFNIIKNYLNVKKGKNKIDRTNALDFISSNKIIQEEFANENGLSISKPIDLTISIYSEKIYDYLSSKKINIKLKIKEKEVFIPVFYTEKTSSNYCAYNNEIKKNGDIICIVSQNMKSKRMHSFNEKKYNPIEIELTKEQAKQATSIEASMVMM
jgi:hypothetical protein